MIEGPVIGYVRVSTEIQDFEIQKENIKKYCLQNQLELLNIYEDKITGTTLERPGLEALLNFLNGYEKNIKYLIINDITRISRKTTDLFNLAQELYKKNILIYIIKSNTILDLFTDNPTINFLNGVAALISELDFGLLKIKMADGYDRAYKKAKSNKMSWGRPEKILNLSKKQILNYLDMGVTKTAIAKLCGCSKETLITRLKKWDVWTLYKKKQPLFGLKLN